jgi:hypothetical protein
MSLLGTWSIRHRSISLSCRVLSKRLIHRPIKSHQATNAKLQTLTITQPWLKLNCSLGEGPFWEDDTNSLRFLDVEKLKVHRVDLKVGPSSHKVIKDFDISIR